MDNVIAQKLLQTNNLAEKAAITAKYFFGQLSREAAKVAKQCVIFHWFDKSIIEALLQETEFTDAEKEHIYQQLSSLPFVEQLPWGQRYQSLTREGLLNQYSLTQPELLQEAARLAAPAYASRKENKMGIAESLFCYIFAGNRSESIHLLDELMEQTISHEDWSYASELIRLQDEAEGFRFVLSLPRTEQYWIQRGTVHSTQGKLEAALADYEQAIRINFRNISAYIGRGKVFAKQRKYKRALADYNYALKFEPTNIHIYTNRSAVYTKLGQYEDALRDIDRSLEIEPQNPYVLYNKGTVLSDMEQFEQTLAVYNTVLEIYPDMVEAYIGKGEALFDLQRYTESLEAFEEAIHLDGYLANAQRGKGNALLALKRYEEAGLAYEEARQLVFYTTGMDDGVVEQTPVTQETFQDENHVNGEQKRLDVLKNRERLASLERLRRKDGSRRQPRKRKIYLIGSYLGGLASIAAVAALIFASLVIFRSIHLLPRNRYPIIGKQNTATSQVQRTVVATVDPSVTPTDTRLSRPGTPYLFDPMTNPASQDQWDVINEPFLSCSFSNGGYDLKSPANSGGGCNTEASTTVLTDFIYEINMTIVSGITGSNSGAGLTFRYDNQNPPSLYTVSFKQDGTYYMFASNKGGPGATLGVGHCPSFHQGPNQTNLIDIEVQGSTFKLFVNDTYVTAATDNQFKSGQIGVEMGSGSAPAEVVFSDLKIWKL